MKYFAYDPEGGHEFFNSKEDAIEYCNQALEIAQECAQFELCLNRVSVGNSK